jgi:hypothetical protein
LGLLFPIYGKIKNVPNHQPEYYWYQTLGIIGEISSAENSDIAAVARTFTETPEVNTFQHLLLW